MNTMEHYDFIIAGGGLAGLSLACHLVHSPLRDRRILIVDIDPKKSNDRTWGYWSDRPLFFDDIVCHRWDRLQVASDGKTQILPLGRHRYCVIRGIDFYNYAREQLAPYPNVDFLQGRVDKIEDGKHAASVTVDGRQFAGMWVFDSLPPRIDPNAPDAEHYHYLRMHFRGWEIRTPDPVFDPRTLTFLDFRVPQERALRFFYVLPFTERRAMVEYTLFSDQTLRRDVYEEALRSYLKETLGVDTYDVVSTERGSVPITDQPLPRQRGRRILSIGAKAGRIKPSTGYAFVRVQKDSAGIVDSLLLYGHPFDVPEDPDLYDLLDAVMLQVMEHHGQHIQHAFTAMFQRNPVDHIFNFLDESATPWENLLLVSSLPPQIFVRSALSLLKVPPRAIRGMMEG